MIRVTAAIFENEGKILIAQRKRGKHLGLKWEFPGGRIENDETPEECLKREIAEEFNVDIKVGDFVGSSIHSYKRGKIELIAFRVNSYSGQLKLNDHEKIQWVHPRDILSYDLAEADIPIAKTIIRERKNDI